ncbi:10043_t:CDS:2 [Cetraspora pellucida]|uniref:10043_t:CDS:1 n=1 Tax=Cetraspora pellucida TaxID=1433469 RepID=A0A9N9EZW5_9GLOM|nr:10043_t:CDS:2 [Cetraspora pellucida]
MLTIQFSRDTNFLILSDIHFSLIFLGPLSYFDGLEDDVLLSDVENGVLYWWYG